MAQSPLLARCQATATLMWMPSKQRRPIRPETDETKSRAGRRTVGVPGELVALLRKHQNEQNQEQETARQLWRGGGWLFATRTGGPLNPNTDYHEWMT